jgi:hypothetical protein
VKLILHAFGAFEVRHYLTYQAQGTGGLELLKRANNLSVRNGELEELKTHMFNVL